MISFGVLLSIVSLVSFTNAIGQVGLCKDKVIEVVSDFKVANYSGLWYEVHRYDYSDELGMDCVTAKYTLNDTTVMVHNMGVFNKTMFMIDGMAELTNSTETEAKLTVTFPSMNTSSPYWVLSTDYKNYAVVYTCKDLEGGNSTVTSWILSRKTVLSGESMIQVNAALTKANLDWAPFRATLHTEEACHSGASFQTLTLALSLISALLVKLM